MTIQSISQIGTFLRERKPMPLIIALIVSLISFAISLEIKVFQSLNKCSHLATVQVLRKALHIDQEPGEKMNMVEGFCRDYKTVNQTYLSLFLFPRAVSFSNTSGKRNTAWRRLHKAHLQFNSLFFLIIKKKKKNLCSLLPTLS